MMCCDESKNDIDKKTVAFRKRKIIFIIIAVILVVCLLGAAVSIILNCQNEYVSVSVGEGIILAVKRNGKVVTIGENSKIIDEVKEWENVTSIGIGYGYAVGVKEDGTILWAGDSVDDLRIVVEKWKDISSVSAYATDIVGLKNDGTVVTVSYVPPGYNPDEDFTKSKDNSWQIERNSKVEKWENIVSLTAGPGFVIGVKKDGTIISDGVMNNEISEWENIVSISSCALYTVGLKENGTVVTTCQDEEIKKEIEGWEDIAYVSCGTYHYDFWNYSRSECYTVGIKKDGSIVCVGNDSKLCSEIEDW